MLNQLLLTGNWFTNIFRNLTFWIDKGIYSLVQSAYAVFYYLADARLLNDQMVQNVTVRIYTLLSIIMVFVLAFNLLNYIVDPDKINDKKIGASAFVKDVVIALAVIALTPTIFTKLYALQGQILSSGVIANLILGGNSSTAMKYDSTKYKSITDYYIQNGANTMVSSIYVAFLYPEDGFTALDCHSDTTTPEELSAHQNYCDAYDKANSGYGISAFDEFVTNDNYNFTPFLTTVAGVVLLFFMLSFCINLAKRVGKLAIIQFVAPIPMVLELIPNKKGLRKTWFDTLIKVYLEVFMFLGVMYIIVFLISLVPNVVGELFKAGGDGLSLVKLVTTVILIFGLLQFGKEAPKLLCDLLGIKDSGVIGEAAKRALAMGGVSFGLAGSTVGRFARNATSTYKESGGGLKGLGAGFLSGIGGATSGAARTLWGARNVHNLKDAQKLRKNVNQSIVTARVNRDAYAQAHDHKLKKILGGHIQDIGVSAYGGVKDYLGAVPSSNNLSHVPGIGKINNFVGKQNLYETKKQTEKVNQGIKDIYNSKIRDRIFKADAVWTQLNAMKAQAEANGGSYVAPDGSTTSLSTIKARIKTTESSLINDKKNAIKVSEALGEMQNYNDANQGIIGITDKHYDFSHLIKNDGTVDMSLYDAFIDDVKTNGYDAVLDSLAKDGVYQQQRVDERLKENAKETTKKAAEEANKKSGDKK